LASSFEIFIVVPPGFYRSVQTLVPFWSTEQASMIGNAEQMALLDEAQIKTTQKRTNYDPNIEYWLNYLLLVPVSKCARHSVMCVRCAVFGHWAASILFGKFSLQSQDRLLSWMYSNGQIWYGKGCVNPR